MAVLESITHETGDFTQYDSYTDNADLTIAAAAALVGSRGMSIVINDAGVLNGAAGNWASTTGLLRFRFYIDPNGLTMGAGNNFTIFRVANSASSTLVAVMLWSYDGADAYRISVDYRTDGGGYVDGTRYGMTDAKHYIEGYFVKAETNVSSDGSVTWWLDGTQISNVTGLDNYDTWTNMDDMWFGAVNQLDAGTSGTFYLDDLVITSDGTLIGPAVVSTPMTLTGGATPTGTVVKSIGSARAGGVTPTGTIARVLNLARTLTGGITPTGTIARVLNLVRAFAGGITPAGPADYTFSNARTLTGASTPTGTLARALTFLRTITGAMTQAGTLVRSLGRGFAGGATPSGTLARVLNLVRTFTGAVSSAGSHIGQLIAPVVTNMTLTGAVAMSGSITRGISRLFAGLIDFVGSFAKFILIPSPPARVFSVEAESRTVIVEADNRTNTINI